MIITGTPPSGGQLPYVSTLSFDAATGVSTFAANTVVVTRFRVFAPISVNQATVFIGTASGNIDIGVWRSNETTLTLLTSTGSTAAAGTNATQTIALLSAVTLLPGIDYYAGCVPNNATVTFGRAAVNAAFSTLGKRSVSIGSAFPLATNGASIALSGTSAATLIPFIYLDHT